MSPKEASQYNYSTSRFTGCLDTHIARTGFNLLIEELPLVVPQAWDRLALLLARKQSQEATEYVEGPGLRTGQLGPVPQQRTRYLFW